MRKIHLVVNPESGHKKGKLILEKVKKEFQKANIFFDIHISEFAGHAIDLGRTLELNGWESICVIGGDGTMNEVINGMMSREDNVLVPIGMVPAGTGNSLMHDLDCLDRMSAVKKIIRRQFRKLDLFEVRTKQKLIYGFNVLGWGIPVDVNIRAEKMRWSRGQRYNLAALIEIIRKKIRPAKIVFDDKILEGQFTFVVACNTMYSGNNMKMAPPAQFDDGKIDLLVVRDTSRLKILSLFTKVFKGAHFNDPIISHFLVEKFSIYTKEAYPLNIDGQTIGETPIEVRMLPGHIQTYG